MVLQTKILCFLSVILFIGSTNALSKRYWSNSNETAIIDRFVASQKMYTLQIDRTAFSVDQPVWLEQFDISKVFGYELIKQRPVYHVSVMVKIFEIAEGIRSLQATELLFMKRVDIGFNHETKIILPSEFLLKPGFVYEIRVELPENMTFTYNDELTIGTYKIDRPLSKPITVDFYQHNSGLQNVDHYERKLSHGMVKDIHLKYSQF